MIAWPETRDTLLARLRNPSDFQAWSEFTRLYQPLIHRFAMQRGLQDVDAQDITQHVLWAVARAAEEWQPDPTLGKFRGWLATVTRNATLNLLQREERHRGTGRSSVWDFLQTIPAPDGELSLAWEREKQNQIFRTAAEAVRPLFSEDIWQIFWRTAVGGEAIEAVAAEMGKSIGAAYAGRSRIMAHLRKAALQIEQSETALETDQAPREKTT